MRLRRPSLFFALLLSVVGCDRALPTRTGDSPSVAELDNDSADAAKGLKDSSRTPAALSGNWFLWQIDTLMVRGQEIELLFEDTGWLRGTDGCNSFQSNFAATDTTLRIDFSRAFMLFGRDTTWRVGPVADYLHRVRTWRAGDIDLVLSDSSGRLLLRYGRTKPKPLPTTHVDSIHGKDTSGIRLSRAEILATRVSDSGVLIDLILPVRGLEVRLFALESFQGKSAAFADKPNPSDSTRYPMRPEPTYGPQKILVAGWDADPADLHLQSSETVRVFVPWTRLQPYVSFVDGWGGVFTHLRPGWTLL